MEQRHWYVGRGKLEYERGIGDLLSMLSPTGMSEGDSDEMLQVAMYLMVNDLGVSVFLVDPVNDVLLMTGYIKEVDGGFRIADFQGGTIKSVGSPGAGNMAAGMGTMQLLSQAMHILREEQNGRQGVSNCMAIFEAEVPLGWFDLYDPHVEHAEASPLNLPELVEVPAQINNN